MSSGFKHTVLPMLSSNRICWRLLLKLLSHNRRHFQNTDSIQMIVRVLKNTIKPKKGKLTRLTMILIRKSWRLLKSCMRLDRLVRKHSRKEHDSSPRRDLPMLKAGLRIIKILRDTLQKEQTDLRNSLMICLNSRTATAINLLRSCQIARPGI